jgi:hypothetical protein
VCLHKQIINIGAADEFPAQSGAAGDSTDAPQIAFNQQ